MMDALKEEVFQANLFLFRNNLISLTWGNVSGIDRSTGRIAIKPSGVEYERMTIEDIVVVDLNGDVIEGRLRASSDMPTHLELYKAFASIGGVVHTHSPYATMFAQALREIPCLGTTHADHFVGPVPLTRFLNENEVIEGYEMETGAIIVERFAGMNPTETPAVLVAGHGPFAWGKSATDAVKNGLIVEKVAEMALGTLQLNPAVAGIPQYIQDKHYQRKHGPKAYYGQEK